MEIKMSEMKINKLTNKLMSGLLVAGFSTLSLSYVRAQDNSLVSYPTLVNTCNFDVHIPEGSGGYAFSPDCKVLYVHPHSKGKIESKVFLPELTSACKSLASSQASFEIDSRRLEKIKMEMERLEQLDNLTREQKAKLERLSTTHATLLASINANTDIFNKWSGGSGGARLSAKSTAEAVREYVVNNQHLIRNGVRIEPMPILSGVMSIKNHRKELYFPQLLNAENIGRLIDDKSDRESVHSVGHGQVAIELGLSSACKIEQEKERVSDRSLVYTSKIIDDLLIGILDPKFEYTYPVVANVGYQARIVVDRAVQIIMEQFKTKNEFSLNEVSNMLGRGHNEESFEMTITFGNNNPSDVADDLKNKIAENLIGEVRERLTLRLVATMQDLGLVEIVATSPDVSTTDGGYQAVPDGYIERCSTKRLLGVKVSKNCRLELRVRRIYKEGMSHGSSEAVQSINIEILESVNINEIERLMGDVTF